MQIYLPIAEVSVNAFLLLGIGGIVGVLSGMFGVGGGFLITPLLFFVGIPPAVAVATSANQVVASSVSGVLAHFKRRTVDFRMGLVLLAGGLVGSAAGVQVFTLLRQAGQVDLLVQLSYVIFLGIVGALMFVESLNALRKVRSGAPPTRRKHNWIHALPFKVKFRTSGLYISVIPPLLVGALVGVLAAVMGVGGGFLMVPAMIYLLGMPTKVVVGTSLFQIIFVTAFTTLLHAVTNYSVDMILAVLLLLGGVVGAQIGTTLGARLRAEQLRILLATSRAGGGRKDRARPASRTARALLPRPGGALMLRVALLLLLLALPAKAEEVVAALSQNRVSIDTNFDGSEILVFGAIRRESAIPEGDLHVIVTIAGPSDQIVVRRKSRMLGIWVNTEQVLVDRAPAFYAVSTSGPWAEVISETEDLRHSVSIPRAIRAVGTGVMDSPNFVEALIRLRVAGDLYQTNVATVEVAEATLFRTSVALPANLTEGNYRVRFFLTREGQVIDMREEVIFVQKVGLERFLYVLAHEAPLAYGLLSIAIAIGAGWGASAAFRYLRS
jgi:uncharacterized protein